MTFIEWINREQPEGPTLAAAIPRSYRATRVPERLCRIEAMLRTLMEEKNTNEPEN